jgi:glycosyltransferase involved in cell wall biosynthesis
MTSTSVSVVVAVLNAERYLREALDSVVRQGHPAEVVVVDGGSKDDSVAIASSYQQVRCITQRGEGLGNAWNEGIAASSSDLIAFLDSDDRWLPGKLEAQMGLLEADRELSAVIGMMRFFREPGEPLPRGFRAELLEGEHVGRMPGALLVRRRTFDELGAFEEGYRIAVDVDWFARLKDAGLGLGVVPEVVLEKRVHGSHLSHSDIDLLADEMTRLFRASVARQRASDEHSN